MQYTLYTRFTVFFSTRLNLAQEEYGNFSGATHANLQQVVYAPRIAPNTSVFQQIAQRILSFNLCI